jgi:2-iminobutanoate/2-iminopropanoate deaminase
MLHFQPSINAQTVIVAPNAPKAIGPYSHAVKAGGLVFVSGSIGVVPATGEFAGADVATQADQVLKNMRAILEAAGCTMGDVVKTTILLADMADFATVNAVYQKHFEGLGSGFPARATFAVKTLPKNALVEIEAVAVAK